MKIVYVGPASEGVEIAATGQLAMPGKPIEVDDELGMSLLEQDIWQSAEPTKKPAAPADKE